MTNTDFKPVESFTDIDILLGKNKICFNHVGNRRFREIIGNSLDDYQSIDSRKNKSQIVNNLIASIYSSGSRFLKFDKQKETWLEIPKGHKIIKEKVGHALRDSINYKPKSTGISRGKELAANRQKKSKVAIKKVLDKKNLPPTDTIERTSADGPSDASDTSMPDFAGSSITKTPQTSEPNKNLMARSISPSNSCSSIDSIGGKVEEQTTKMIEKNTKNCPRASISLSTPDAVLSQPPKDTIHVIPDITMGSESIPPIPTSPAPQQVSSGPAPTSDIEHDDFLATVSDSEDFNDDTLSLLELIATTKEEELDLPLLAHDPKSVGVTRGAFTTCFNLTPLTSRSISSKDGIQDIMPPLLLQRQSSALDEFNLIATENLEQPLDESSVKKCHFEEKIDFHLDMIEKCYEDSELVADRTDLHGMDLEMPSLECRASDWVDCLENLESF